jgi:hypothetical protein
MMQADSLYGVDEEKLTRVRQEMLWLQDPRYFKKIKIAPSATIKMQVHGQSGVEKGIKKSGKPIEVMGLLVGRPDTEDRDCVIITDAQPLPIEGFETRVIADDENIINYMIELSEMNEIMKKERYIHSQILLITFNHVSCFVDSLGGIIHIRLMSMSIVIVFSQTLMSQPNFNGNEQKILMVTTANLPLSALTPQIYNRESVVCHCHRSIANLSQT